MFPKRVGLRACNDKKIEATVWKTDQLDSKLYIFDCIKMYLTETSTDLQKRDHFILYINYNYNINDINPFYKNMNLFKQILCRYINVVCEKISIFAQGDGDSTTDNGTRAP